MRKKTLKWGRTPWDKMSREELLREVQKYYSALVALESCLKNIRDLWQINNPYFGYTGSGGRALEKARQILEPLHAQYKEGSGELYSAFFRYADDLLFDRSTPYRLGSGWAVCPVCGTMLSETAGGDSVVGKTCSEALRLSSCPGVYRALTWEDLSPRK